MCVEKSKSDNDNREDEESISLDVNDGEEENTIYDIDDQYTDLDEDIATKEPSSETTNDCDVNSLADKVANINILRFELDRLQLDFKARAYFENDVRPLIDTLYTLSYASINYSATANNFASTNFGHSSKIKDALDLAEEVNMISEDLVEVLKCKVHKMIKFSKYDCK